MSTANSNTSKNVIVGAAAVFLSATDSRSWVSAPVLPALTALQTAVTPLNAAVATWRNIGFTKDGIEVQFAPTFGEIEVDQLLDAAKLFKQSVKVNVLTNFVEATLENLLVAWGMQTSADSSSVDLLSGALFDEPVERALAFVGPAPRGAANAKQERLYYVTRALVDSSTNHMLRRSEATTFPVTFRLLPDTTQTNSRYGQVLDRAVT